MSNFILLTSFMLLTGCSTTVSELSSDMNPSVTPNSVKIPSNTLLYIQFPMVATEEAKSVLKRNYICNWSDLINHPLSTCDESIFTNTFALAFLERSTYYAAELKKIFEKYGLKNQIILEPLLIDHDENGFSIRKAQESRISKIAEIQMYDFEGIAKEAYGSGYNPKVAVRLREDQSPLTCGYVLISPDHLLLSNVVSCPSDDSRQVSYFNPLDYFHDDKLVGDNLPRHNKGGITLNSILTVPSLWEKNKSDYLSLTSNEKYQVTPSGIDNSTSDWIARITLVAIEKSNNTEINQASIADYAQNYDMQLAEKVRSGIELSAHEKKQMLVISKLMDAEIGWLSAQNEAVVEGILNGGFGKSFRKDRLLLANAYEQSQTLGLLNIGATLVSGYSSGLFGGTGEFDPSLLMAMHSRNEQYFSDKYEKLGEAVMGALAPSQKMRETILEITFEETRISLQAGNYRALKDQMKSIYRKLAK